MRTLPLFYHLVQLAYLEIVESIHASQASQATTGCGILDLQDHSVVRIRAIDIALHFEML